MEKKFTIDFKGSMVKTTQVFAYMFLVIAFIGTLITFIATDGSALFTFAVFGSCIFLFFILICLSTILEQLYVTRKLLEIKVESEGFEITLL